jgi:hypothetical protein
MFDSRLARSTIVFPIRPFAPMSNTRIFFIPANPQRTPPLCKLAGAAPAIWGAQAASL